MGTWPVKLDCWRRLPRAAAASLLLTGLLPIATAEESAPTVSVRLAKCELQAIQVQANNEMLSVGIVANAPTTEDTLSYRRSAAGDWIVPEKVDPSESSMQGLLLTPAGPMLIEVTITINDRPFRAVREQWIDAALSPGQRPPDAESADAEPTGGERLEATQESEAPPAQRFVGQSPRDWLVNYVRIAESGVERYEARWLLAQRANGPALMELQRFSKSRSAQAPLVHFLDSNGDSQIDSSELQSANERLVAADYNQDGAVDLRELSKATSGNSRFRPWSAQPLFAVVDDATDWADLAYRWKVPDASLTELAESSPAVTLHISLGAEASMPGVELEQVDSPDFAQGESTAVRTRTDAIAARFSWGDLEFAAGQAESAGDASQVSVGATTEGAPLWSIVDADQDNRLSTRERGSLLSLLSGLDADADGAISQAEIPSRIRWSAALGPAVHQMLLRDTPLIPAETPESNTAPDWFVSMDVNHDGDLAAGEFLGTPEQFDSLDSNEDGLISAIEASK